MWTLSLQLLYQKLTGLRTDLSGTQEVPDILIGNKTNSDQHVTATLDDNSSTSSSNTGGNETCNVRTVYDNNETSVVNDDGDNDNDNASDNDDDDSGSEEGSETGKKGTIIRPRDESPNSKKVSYPL